MKQKLLYLFVLVLIVGAGIGVKVFILDADGRRVGYLQVYSTPDATVFIDARAVGKTPYTQPLKPGSYAIKLIPIVADTETQNANAGVTWEGKIKIEPYQYTYVRRELRNTEVESTGEIASLKKSANILPPGQGEIIVESEPEGAVVSFNGRDMGVSPYLIKNVPEGIHEISVSMARFKRRTIQVKVVSGYTTVSQFQLGLDIDFDKKYEFAKAFEASGSATLPNIPTAAPSATPTPTVDKVEIEDTPTGFLRVRNEGNLNGREISQVKPGEIYPYLGEENGWIKIKLTDGNEGWVKGEYLKKLYKTKSE